MKIIKIILIFISIFLVIHTHTVFIEGNVYSQLLNGRYDIISTMWYVGVYIFSAIFFVFSISLNTEKAKKNIIKLYTYLKLPLILNWLKTKHNFILILFIILVISIFKIAFFGIGNYQ